MNFISRFFTSDHWAHPFTITEPILPSNPAKPGNPANPTDLATKPLNPANPTDPAKSIEIGGGKKTIAVMMAVFTGVPTGGVLAVPFFFLFASLMKSLEIYQIKAKNLTGTPGKHQTIPRPNPSPSPGPGPSPSPGVGLPLPPVNGVQVGITNLANTCWLNASMKLMATTTFWDPILEMPTTTPQQADLQKVLKKYITRMRTAEGGVIKKKDAQRLEQEVNKLIKDDPMVGGQMDAAEFFLCLHRVFQYPSEVELNPDSPSKNFYQSTVVYDSVDPDFYHVPNAETADPLIKIAVPYAEALGNAPLDPVTLLKKIDTRTYREDEQNDKAPQINYTTKHYPLNLPETLNLNFSRIVGVEDEQGRQKFDASGQMEQVRCNRPLALDSNGHFELIEYDRAKIELDDSGQWVLYPRKKCVYELTGAIIHGGSDKDGHYTAVERAPNGKFFYHNDQSVTELDTSEAIKRCENNGVMLRFKRIKDITLTDEEVKEIRLKDLAG